MPSYFTFLSLALVGAGVMALQEIPGSPCSLVGHACEYSYPTDSGAIVHVKGHCAPNNFCADNGAKCDSEDNCYNSCGTDGICGGVGASCDSQEPSFHGQYDEACFTPTDVCSTTGGVSGTCASAVSAGSSKSKHRRDSERAMNHKRSFCFAVGETTCPSSSGGMSDGYECVDTLTDLESCGGCVTLGEGEDCTAIPGAQDVSCASGSCLIATCQLGYDLSEGLCVPI